MATDRRKEACCVDSSASLRTGLWVFSPSRPGVCWLWFYQERMVLAAPANELRGQVKEFSFCSLAQPMSSVSSKSSRPFHTPHPPAGEKPQQITLLWIQALKLRILLLSALLRNRFGIWGSHVNNLIFIRMHCSCVVYYICQAIAYHFT